MVDDQPWWVAKDVCEVLAISWTGHTLDNLSTKHKGTVKFTTRGGAQGVWCIDEAGLYKLIMRSNKPEAEKFQDWVTEEVLPSIRKHGAYMTGSTIEQVYKYSYCNIGIHPIY